MHSGCTSNKITENGEIVGGRNSPFYGIKAEYLLSGKERVVHKELMTKERHHGESGCLERDEVGS